MFYDENNNYYDFIFKEKNEVYNFEHPEFKEKNSIFNLDNVEFEEETFNLNSNINFDIGSININNMRHGAKVTDPMDGLNKGNLFTASYIPYKNYNYRIKVNGKRDEMLLKIQALCFAIKDLELYLDVHPNEEDKIALLQSYLRESRELKDLYAKDYNPLNIKDAKNPKHFTWIDNPWPWDKGGSN